MHLTGGVVHTFKRLCVYRISVPSPQPQEAAERSSDLNLEKRKGNSQW